MPTTVRKSLVAFGVGTLLAIPVAANAATIDIVATADGQVTFLSGSPTTVATLANANLSQNLIAGQEVRSVYEFDLPTLTEPIVSATFVGTATQNSNAPGTLTFYGYSGNGTIEAADATQLTTSIGSVVLPTQIATTLPLAVPLSADFITSLGSGFLGITTTAAQTDTILVASLEGTVGTRPTLRLVTEDEQEPPPTIPEPGATLLFTGAVVGVAARWRRSRPAQAE